MASKKLRFKRDLGSSLVFVEPTVRYNNDDVAGLHMSLEPLFAEDAKLPRSYGKSGLAKIVHVFCFPVRCACPFLLWTTIPLPPSQCRATCLTPACSYLHYISSNPVLQLLQILMNHPYRKHERFCWASIFSRCGASHLGGSMGNCLSCCWRGMAWRSFLCVCLVCWHVCFPSSLKRRSVRAGIGGQRTGGCGRFAAVFGECKSSSSCSTAYKLMWPKRGETDFFTGEPLRSLSTLVYSENVDLQRSASLTFAEITERGWWLWTVCSSSDW